MILGTALLAIPVWLTSNNTSPGKKLNCFFYCTEDHDATPHKSPTGADSSWSQKFFFEPDIGTQNDVTIKADIINFNNSFKERLKTTINPYGNGGASEKIINILNHIEIDKYSE